MTRIALHAAPVNLQNATFLGGGRREEGRGKREEEGGGRGEEGGGRREGGGGRGEGGREEYSQCRSTRTRQNAKCKTKCKQVGYNESTRLGAHNPCVPSH